MRLRFVGGLLTLLLTMPWMQAAAASEGEALDACAPSILSAFQGLVEGEVEEVIDAFAAFAASDAVRSGEWARMEPMLAAYEEARGMDAIIWFARPDGGYFAVGKGLVDRSLSDRGYFPALMAGERIVGAPVVSKSTGRKSAVIAVPVIREGEVVGGLGMSLFLGPLSQRIARVLSLPDRWVFYAIAPNGMTTLNSDRALLFEDPRRQGIPSLEQAFQTLLHEGSGSVTYEVGPYRRAAIFETSELLGWRFAVARTIATVEAPIEPAAKRVTPETVERLVTRAAGLIEEEGEAAFPAFRERGSRWFSDDLYVFVWDLEGNRYVYPPDPEYERGNFLGLQDTVGRAIGRRMVEIARDQGEGWIRYSWPRPGKSVPETKSTFVKRAQAPGGTTYLVGAGRYNLREGAD